jgi:hypothetical protein
MKPTEPRDETLLSGADLSQADRRHALRRLGLAAGALYLAPALSALSGARAQADDKEAPGGPNWKKPSKPVKPSKPGNQDDKGNQGNKCNNG